MRYIAAEAELVCLLQKPRAVILTLRNGQMTLSTLDCRLDILMVYELVQRRVLEVASPEIIELSKDWRKHYQDFRRSKRDSG